MKLSDFILLNEEQKKLAVLHKGVLIGKKIGCGSTRFLFQVGNYYVEACFNSNNKDIEEFRMFNRTSFLQPYLDSISIDDLLN